MQEFVVSAQQQNDQEVFLRAHHRVRITYLSAQRRRILLATGPKQDAAPARESRLVQIRAPVKSDRHAPHQETPFFLSRGRGQINYSYNSAVTLQQLMGRQDT
jgi:hypothetical protein